MRQQDTRIPGSMGARAPVRTAPAGSMLVWAVVLSSALILAAGMVAGCATGETDVRDAGTSEPATGPPLFDEDRSFVTEDPGSYVGVYEGRFERFFEGRGTVSISLSMTVTQERVTGAWDDVADVPGEEPLQWHTSGEFSAEVREDGTFSGEGTAVTYTNGASTGGTSTPQPVQVLGRLSDDALILGDIVFEEGALTFQAVREE